MRTIYLKLSFSFILCILVQGLFSQNGESLMFRSFDIRDGLSQNTVYDILSTQDGLMWLCTIDGLNRFDGSEFIQFKPQGELKSFGSVINCVAEVNDSLLLTGTSNGLLLFDVKRGIFKLPNSEFSSLDLRDISIDEVYGDQQKQFLIRARDQLFAFDIDQNQLRQINSTLNEEVKHCQHTDSGFLFSTTNSIYFLDQNQDPVKFFDSKKSIKYFHLIGENLFVYTEGEPLHHFRGSIKNGFDVFKSKQELPSGISCLASDEKQNLLIGTRNNGFFSYDLKSSTILKSYDDLQLSGLRSNFILDIFCDSNEMVWLGTSGGGFAIALNNISSFDYLRPTELNAKSDDDDMVLGLREMKSGEILLGGLSSGLKILDPKTRELEIFTSEVLPEEAMNMYDFIEVANKIYIASWSGLLEFDRINKLIKRVKGKHNRNVKLYTIAPNADAGFYVGGQEGLLYYDLKLQEFSELIFQKSDITPEELIVRHIELIDESHLLIATTNHNVLRYNIQTTVLEKFENLTNFSNSARHFNISDSELLIATDNGLIIADKNSLETIETWTKENGLSNDFVYAVMSDKDGRIWLSTNKGIIEIDRQKEKVVNYDLIDGLQSYEYNTAAVLKDNNDNIYFGGIKGLNKISSTKRGEEFLNGQPILSSIRVNNSTYETPLLANHISSLSLPYDSNFVSFKYSTPFHWTDKMSYEYKLDGLTNEWIEFDNNSSLSFTDLRPGNYTLNVRSVSNNSTYSNYSELLIQIRPEFWQTLWFKTVMALLTLSGIYVLYRYRIRQKEKDFQVHKKFIELENTILRNRMNPHFIFNTLNSIKHHSLFKSKEETSEYITKFSKIIRGILEYNNQRFLSLEQDIEWIKEYVNIERRRFEDSFEFEINIDPDLDTSQEMIPPFLIQPFVENAIWHGLLHNKNNPRLTLSYKKTNDAYECIIEDNGIGRKATENIANSLNKKSFGLQITNERIQNLKAAGDFDVSYKFEDLTSDSNESLGTKVIVKIVSMV